MKLKNGRVVTSYFIPVRDGGTRIEAPMEDVLIFYFDVSHIPHHNQEDIAEYMKYMMELMGDSDDE